jgi:hypothetical protein
MRACVSACASTFLVCTDKVMVAGVGDFVVNSYVHPVMRILQLSATPVPLISSVYGVTSLKDSKGWECVLRTCTASPASVRGRGNSSNAWRSVSKCRRTC